MDAVCGSINPSEMREALDQLSPCVEDTVTQTWNRVLEQDPRCVSLAQATLVWVLHSPRPMTVDELQRAVAASTENFQFDSDRLVSGEMLVSLCCGLVTFEWESGLLRLIRECSDCFVDFPI